MNILLQILFAVVLVPLVVLNAVAALAVIRDTWRSR